jgi:branched-chain amino acid transport system ATP-binding protein
MNAVAAPTGSQSLAPALLETRDLHAWYGQTQALFGLNLRLEKGRIVALLGANGAGKTTTLRALCSMVRTQGEVLFDGERIQSNATEQMARQGIAHVPEGRGTFVNLSVEQNLRVGASVRRDKAQVMRDFEQVLHYFPRLRERLRQQAGTLSGGEQQMLAIGRALMLRPRVMLLDEPSFGLAPLVVKEIFRILRKIGNEGVSLLLVEQNARLALDLADHAYLLETGRLVLDAPATQMANNDSVRRTYLGY